MDDASAFRAASEVQNAYRKLIGAAELVDRVVEIRRQMCNNAGNAAAIDFPQPNVFRDAEFFGGLRYGMVSNFYDLYQAGTWPASEMPKPGRSFTSRPARRSRRWSRPTWSATGRTICPPPNAPPGV
jgi:hypothetical protein